MKHRDATRNDHPLFDALVHRDGRHCAVPGCWERALVVVPRDETVSETEAVRLGLADLVAICPGHARQFANQARRAREQRNAETLAAAQLGLFAVD